MKTWHFESFFVLAILLATTIITHGRWQDYLAVLGVWLGFGCTSISERLRERQSTTSSKVECSTLMTTYIFLREFVWICFFISIKSYPALVGCFINICYPYWRMFWRKLHPMKIQG